MGYSHYTTLCYILIPNVRQLLKALLNFMIAVIKTGGKQYKVAEGDKIRVEKLDVEKDASITFDEVLLVSDPEGGNLKIGEPTVSGAKVSGKVLSQGRTKKIDVIKYKRKVRYRRKRGHRQHFTEVQIEKITA